ncbi:MAG: lamin tail domain-containing protein [Candidatus Bipolaricaulia bacterium]
MSYRRGLGALLLLGGIASFFSQWATTQAASVRDVVISEVAWMGTQADSNDEWIELYNTTGQAIDLTGWKLEAADGTPSITLSGTIPAHSFFLLERTDDTTVSDISADQIYTGSLSNSGEALSLKDPSNNVIDTANGDGGAWPAGTSSPRATMERIDLMAPDSDTNWDTNDGVHRNGLDANNNPINGTPKAPRQRASYSALDVIISEVAWAGTQADANDEWIELYNNTNQVISLTGWRLESSDGTPSIALVGTIAAHGFFLLERTDDTTVSDITADQIYTGALSNTGETLILKDPSGNVIDTANGDGGPWPAGNDLARASMERLDVLAPDSDTKWATNNEIYRNGVDALGNPINGTPKAHKPPYVTITNPITTVPVYVRQGESFTVGFTSDEMGTSEIKVNGTLCGGGAVTVGANTQNCTLPSPFAHGVYDLSVTVTDVTATVGSATEIDAVHVILETLGDVNSDGKINVIDARLAQQHADGFITLAGIEFLAADVDQDGDVDSDDATAIAKKGIGLPTGIPWFAFALPALAFLLMRSRRKIATVLFITVGLMGTLTSCTEFTGLPPPSGPAVFITSTSMPNGATRTLDLVVQNVIAQGGVASLQGRIAYPAGKVSVQSLTGLNGFIVKALANTSGELRFALVKPSSGGINNGAIARVTLSASGTPGSIITLSWVASAQTPIVIGGDTNTEITGLSFGDGQVKVR